MADWDMPRSRALVLGTMYPPARAAEGRAAAMARMSLRMVVSPLRRDARQRRVGIGEEEGGGVVLRLQGDAASARAVGDPVGEEAMFHHSARAARAGAAGADEGGERAHRRAPGVGAQPDVLELEQVERVGHGVV